LEEEEVEATHQKKNSNKKLRSDTEEDEEVVKAIIMQKNSKRPVRKQLDPSDMHSTRQTRGAAAKKTSTN